MSYHTDYPTLFSQIKTVTEHEPNLIANLANISALINEAMQDINWVGFYLYQEPDQQLVLGPFQGKVACIRIPLDRGVCGAAASKLTIQRVDDVHQFADHIACDSASNSEIVLPLILNDKLLGVLDIDSPVFSRFSQQDEQALADIADYISTLFK